MKDFIFWKRWTGENKTFLYFSILLLASAFVFTIYYQTQGTNVLADPVLENQVQKETILLDSFEKNYIKNDIEIELFLNTQTYKGGKVKDQLDIYYLFLGFITVALSLWLAAVTKTVNKTWQYRFWILDLLFSFKPIRKFAKKNGWLEAKWYQKGIGIYGLKYFTFITLFAFGLLALNLDAYSDPTSPINTWFLAFLIPLGGASIYFYSFNNKPSLAFRFIVFLLLFAGIYFAINRTIDTPHPLLHLAAFAVAPLSLIALVIIFYSGYRTIHFFLLLSGSERRTAGKQNLINFIIISLLYLLNAFFLLLRDLRYIDLEMMYLSPVLLLLLSFVTGLWSQRLKALEKQQNILVPHALFIYMAGGIISAALLFLAYGTMNEGLIVLLERMIMYANVAVGGIFLLYVVVNFATPLLHGFPVFLRSLHGDVFNFSGVFFIAAGIIAISMNSHYFIEKVKWKAGNYNALRDHYEAQQNGPMRDHYALKAHNSDYYGLKPNYFITQALPGNKLDSIFFHLNKIDEDYTTEYVYTDLAQTRLNQNKEYYFDAINILNDGLKTFPKSSILRNNLGVLYMQYLTDSSYKYLTEGLAFDPNNEAIATNLLKFKAKGYDGNTTVEELDSLIHLNIHTDNILYQSNRLAVARLIASEEVFDFPGNLDSMAVDEEHVSLLYNYLLYLESKPFNPELAERISTKFKGDLTAQPMNQFMAGYGVYQIRKGNIREGVKALSYVVNTCYSYEKPYYANLLAKLLLQQDIEDLALEYFIESDKAQGIYRTNDAYLNRIHLYGKYDKEAALQYLDFMIETGDSSRTVFANELKELFGSNDVKTLLQKDDAFKVKYIHFNPEKPSINKALLASVTSPTQKQLALYEWYIGQNQPIATPNSLTLPENFQQNFNYLYLRQRLAAKDFDAIKAQLDLPLPASKKGYDAFLKGQLAQRDGDTNEAKAYYEEALVRQSFNPDVLLPIVNFYEFTLKDEEKAYQLLLDVVDLHTKSIPLNKAYALMCIRMNYNSFALSTLSELEALLSTEEMNAFLKEVDQAKAIAAEKFNNW